MDAHMTDETKQSIIDGLFRLGTPCILLAAVLWMAREAASSLHATVVVPIVKSHAEYLEASRKTLDGIEETQRQQAVTMQRIAEGQDELKAVLLGRTKESQVN